MKLEQLTPIRHTNPYQIQSEEELLRAFRSRDQKQVVLPKKQNYPIQVQHFFSWAEPSHSYTYLVFKRPNWDEPRGIVFRRSSNQATRGNMCDWCHAYGSADKISLLSVSVNPKLTLGQYLCTDLDCLDNLETQIGMTGKNYDTLAEQVCDKISRFYERIMMNK